MQVGQPSRTALAAAAHRAAHQVLEQGRIFSDPLAVAILGASAEAIAQDAEANPERGPMRAFIAARTRFAEDSLAAAVARGTGQLVILGAGLDTFPYRNPFPDCLRVFEVDHPATQTWKRERLAAAAIPIPASLTFAPIDFERQTLTDGLNAAGFDPAAPAFFTWLGVVPYLTADAVFSTLRFIASLPGLTQAVFDYADPPETLSPEARAYHDRRAARVEAIGEKWLSYFAADPLRAQLLSFGFTAVEDLGPPQLAARFFPERLASGLVPERGGHVLLATKRSP
jgi:methyltransferase (TIGR00027 family)